MPVQLRVGAGSAREKNSALAASRAEPAPTKASRGLRGTGDWLRQGLLERLDQYVAVHAGFHERIGTGPFLGGGQGFELGHDQAA